MITTFYSYKGGVGRSMALANVASTLSQAGLRVLMVDFDLEAPGLEQFFEIDVDEVRRHEGLLDLLLHYKRAMSVAASGESALGDIGNFVVDVHPSLPEGRLHLLPAGKRHPRERLEEYARNLRSFDWQNFYFEWEGERFFEWLRRSLVPEPYDVVLVDSRTGVTEMGGICGYQLADVLVMFCAGNQQNLGGTAAMVSDFRSVGVAALRQNRGLDIVVVPARIEQRDPKLSEAFYQNFDEAFSRDFPAALQEAGLGPRDLTIPYEPTYAFEERVITDPSRAQDRRGIRAAFHRLAHAICRLAPPGSRAARAEETLGALTGLSFGAPRQEAPAPAEPEFDVASRYAEFDACLDGAAADFAAVEQIARSLEGGGVRVFRSTETTPGADLESVMGEALFHSRALVVCVGGTGLSEWRLAMVQKALAPAGRPRPLRVIPVLLPGAEQEILRGTPLASVARVDLRAGLDDEAMKGLARTLAEAYGPATKVETSSRCPFPGMAPFAETDTPFFFGRERMVAEMKARIENTRALSVTGPSACGKTSLVLAGLVPALRAASDPASPWTVAFVAMDAHPSADLSRVLKGLGADSAPGAEATPGDASALDELLRRAIGAEPGRRVLVFVDQLEDLITRCDDEEERSAFAASVAGWLKAPPERATIVVATRADALPALDGLPGLGEAVRATRIDVRAFDKDEYREAIEKPAQRAGLAFEPGLVDRLVSNVVEEPGVLPHLQDMLRRLWGSRRGGWLTNAVFDAEGGLRLLIPARADELLDRLGPDSVNVAKSLLLRMVQAPAGGGPAARRRASLAQLVVERGGAASEASRRKVLDDLVDGRVVVSDLADGESTYELAHDSLARWWTRLQVWLEHDRDWLDWRTRFDAALASWQRSDGNAALLVRGPALDEAVKRRAERAAEFTADEEAFLEQAMDRARTERRRRQVFAGLLGIAFWAVLGVAGYRLYAAYRNNLEMRRVAENGTKEANERYEETVKTIGELQTQVEDLKKTVDKCASNTEAERQRKAAAEKNFTEAQNKLMALRAQADTSRARYLKALPPKK